MGQGDARLPSHWRFPLVTVSNWPLHDLRATTCANQCWDVGHCFHIESLQSSPARSDSVGSREKIIKQTETIVLFWETSLAYFSGRLLPKTNCGPINSYIACGCPEFTGILGKVSDFFFRLVYWKPFSLHSEKSVALNSSQDNHEICMCVHLCTCEHLCVLVVVAVLFLCKIRPKMCKACNCYTWQLFD